MSCFSLYTSMQMILFFSKLGWSQSILLWNTALAAFNNCHEVIVCAMLTGRWRITFWFSFNCKQSNSIKWAPKKGGAKENTFHNCIVCSFFCFLQCLFAQATDIYFNVSCVPCLFPFYMQKPNMDFFFFCSHNAGDGKGTSLERMDMCLPMLSQINGMIHFSCVIYYDIMINYTPK